MQISPSEVERRQSLPVLLCRLWAGLACGVLAGAAALAWFVLHSLLRGEFWWSKFNVAAGWFYGAGVYHAGLGWVTLCGASVIMLFFCLAGACYACVWTALFHTRIALSVLLYAALVHAFAALYLWPSFGSFARLWFPWTAALPAQVGLFAALTRYPGLCLRLVDEFGDPGSLQRKQPVLLEESREAQPSEAAFHAPPDESAQADGRED